VLADDGSEPVPVDDADAAAAVGVELEEAMMEEASDGEMVRVDVETAPAAPAKLARASWLSIWGWVSMKARVGPAMSCVVARSRTLLMRGCWSEVTKMATGPLMPGGTTQLSKGNGMESDDPPIIIWQKSFEVSTVLLMAVEEKLSLVPAPTVPVFVIDKVGLAGIPRSQGPEKKGAAIARTSCGLRAISKAEGIAVPEFDRTLRIVWWRASTVKIEPADVKRTGSVRRVAPPR